MDSFTDPAGKLVMVVDDDKGVRELLEIIVRKEGFRAETAVDGEDALAKIRASRPDIILLDLMLPKFGGFEILRELQQEETAGIPIIIITGRSLDYSTAEMIRREANVREFIEKPIKREVLVSLVHQTLKTRPPRKK
ncbi:MAG TPA: response regulator [Elusimicrobiales bacterium]|nr:response regulator [Elusimicrobiales bacterium]